MTSQGADELRARAYLRALSARPVGHQEPPMHQPEPRTITPTRIIPAGAPLPARAPEPGEAPPWRTPPPPPPPPVAPAPPPGPVEIRHTHEVVLTWADPEPEPEPPLWARLWDWLWNHLVTWRMLVAVLAALTPWLGGDSPVSLWSDAVHHLRSEASVLAAYVVAIGTVATAWALDRRTGRVLPRFLLVTAAVGAFGVFDWWDPILALTGVHK